MLYFRKDICCSQNTSNFLFSYGYLIKIDLFTLCCVETWTEIKCYRSSQSLRKIGLNLMSLISAWFNTAPVWLACFLCICLFVFFVFVFCFCCFFYDSLNTTIMKPYVKRKGAWSHFRVKFYGLLKEESLLWSKFHLKKKSVKGEQSSCIYCRCLYLTLLA